MNIRRIVPDISSADFESSKKFYLNYLGLQPAMELDWIITFISESNPLAQINVLLADKNKVNNENVFISIDVSDIDALYLKAISSNYEIVYPIKNEPWKVRRFL